MQEYGICNTAIIPLRAADSERSEMVSQLLFGETYEILERAGQWVKIVTSLDRYEGWISLVQVVLLDDASYQRLQAEPAAITYGAITQAVKAIDNSVIYLAAASSLAFCDGTVCNIGNDTYTITDKTAGRFANITEAAQSFLNAPYLWGGRTHFGIDCSGLSQAVYRMQGIQLMRDASQQALQGTAVDFLTEVQPGDLAFFDNAEGRIVHVGILLSQDRIIHASGRVKIDCFDHEGIYADDLKRYTHKLRIIKRYPAV